MHLLRTLKPAWWFAAHLHVRFEALFTHDAGSSLNNGPTPAAVHNPDEIVIEDIDEPDAAPSTEAVAVEKDASGPVSQSAPRINPDEILLDDEEEQVAPPPPPPPSRSETKFLSLDKCLPRRQFLEASRIHRRCCD